MSTILSIDTIRKRIIPVMIKHSVIRIILFGSYARGTSDEKSDIDLVIVKKTVKRFFDRMAEFEVLYDLFPGKAIDLLVYNPEELEDISHRTFIRRILSEGIELS